jgi:hypothetical protein
MSKKLQKTTHNSFPNFVKSLGLLQCFPMHWETLCVPTDYSKNKKILYRSSASLLPFFFAEGSYNTSNISGDLTVAPSLATSQATSLAIGDLVE